MMPSVIERVGNSSRAFDLPTKLLTDRIVYLQGEINEETINSAIMQMLWLNSDDPMEPISLYINSPGGDAYQGLALIDIINNLDARVNTVGIGVCMSMGAMLLSAGTGTRKAMPNCRIMIHSVSSWVGGTFQDIKIEFDESQFIQDKMIYLMAKYSKGKTTFDEFTKLTERDTYLGPERAVDLGIIDSVVNPQTGV